MFGVGKFYSGMTLENVLSTFCSLSNSGLLTVRAQACQAWQSSYAWSIRTERALIGIHAVVRSKQIKAENAFAKGTGEVSGRRNESLFKLRSSARPLPSVEEK